MEKFREGVELVKDRLRVALAAIGLLSLKERLTNLVRREEDLSQKPDMWDENY